METIMQLYNKTYSEKLHKNTSLVSVYLINYVSSE